jgi:isopentenyldiphosphate isomerase
MASDPAEEQFETYDDDGQPLGLAPRSRVHALGLWHRSTHVLLFADAGVLIVQRRAADKDLCPGRWDLSVGEHLKPGEDHLTAAHRGLAEELGVSGVGLEPLGAPHRTEHRTRSSDGRLLVDREQQQAFAGLYDGPLTPCAEEVAEVRAVALPDLAAWVRRAPDDFTPWFLDELQRHRLLPEPQR